MMILYSIKKTYGARQLDQQVFTLILDYPREFPYYYSVVFFVFQVLLLTKNITNDCEIVF